MATTITLQQANGTWRISSLFNELVNMTKEDESGATPITPSMKMQQRLQGQWDVKIVSFSAGDPKEIVIRDDLLLLPEIYLASRIDLDETRVAELEYAGRSRHHLGAE